MTNSDNYSAEVLVSLVESPDINPTVGATNFNIAELSHELIHVKRNRISSEDSEGLRLVAEDGTGLLKFHSRSETSK